MLHHHQRHIDPGPIKNKRIAILGYGRQGKAHALNLRDSGIKDLVIALRDGSLSRIDAQRENFIVCDIEEAAKWADVLVFLVPDELHADIYSASIRRYVKAGAALVFAHGLSMHFKLIQPRDDLDVVMVAPRVSGHMVRTKYLRRASVPCVLSIAQDFTSNANNIAYSYAAAIGANRQGFLETTFREECETDLFGEQIILCGGPPAFMGIAFSSLVNTGCAPELAYFHCLHEMLYWSRSENEPVGSQTKSGANSKPSAWIVADEVAKGEINRMLLAIRQGAFIHNWVSACKSGQPSSKMRRRAATQPVVGDSLRYLQATTDWLKHHKLLNSQT